MFLATEWLCCKNKNCILEILAAEVTVSFVFCKLEYQNIEAMRRVMQEIKRENPSKIQGKSENQQNDSRNNWHVKFGKVEYFIQTCEGSWLRDDGDPVTFVVLHALESRF